MSTKKLTDAQRTALAETKNHFTAWRQTKSGREHIPEKLWKEAVNLFHTGGFSVNQIARGLSLSHSTLKKRISGQSKKIQAVQTATAATFIEIDSPHFSSDCVIEMESRSGAKMRMCFRGNADPMLVDLGRHFLAEQA